jgi:hypothetical protein
MLHSQFGHEKNLVLCEELSTLHVNIAKVKNHFLSSITIVITMFVNINFSLTEREVCTPRSFLYRPSP